MAHAKRLKQGRPIGGTGATVADAIGLLSGVNYGTILKVMAAVEALQNYMDSAKIIVADAPIAAPTFDGTEYERVMATRRLVEQVAGFEQNAYLNDILRLDSKFNGTGVG